MDKDHYSATEGFVRLSQFLLGEGRLERSLAPHLFRRLTAHFGESLPKLIETFEEAAKAKDPIPTFNTVVRADKSLSRAAWATLMAWYTGEFKPGTEVPDAPLTANEYSNGFLWHVLKAHAPAFTNAGFGAWAAEPKEGAPKDASVIHEVTVDAEPPLQPKYDVVVVGSGVAGALLAYRLKQLKPKASIAVLEASSNGIDDMARQRFRELYALTVDRDSISPYKRLDAMTRVPSPAAGVDRTHLVQAGPDDFKSNYARLLGGSTWAWRGNCPRFTPNDFQLKSTYGIADDWPIKYADVLGAFGEAEEELGIAGDSSEWDEKMQGGRGRPYPLPPIPQALGDQFLKRALARAAAGKPLVIAGQEIRVIATPQARVTVDGWKGRHQCEGNASCIPICPTGAKYDAGVHVRLAKGLGVEFHTRVVVTRVRLNADGKVTGVVYRTWAKSQEDQSVEANFVVLAGNAIETPRLWLTSKLENSRDLVGRYLMDHVQSDVVCKTPTPIYPFRGPQNTSSIPSFFDHPNRKVVAAFNISVGNDGWGRYVDERGRPKAPFNVLEELSWDPTSETLSMWGDSLQKALRDDPKTAITHMLRLSFSTEQLPEFENRVSLADDRDAFGVPRPIITYKISDYSKRSLTFARGVVRQIITAAGMVPEGADLPNFQYSGAGHLMGTCRMGKDATGSVVDADGCAHAYPNVYVVGSSVFVTGSCTNPTVTLAALAIRTASALAGKL